MSKKGTTIHPAFTAREWKARKRRELKELRKAAELFNWAAIYSPAADDITRVLDIIREMEESCSAKAWGR